jgi:hypothetical protein
MGVDEGSRVGARNRTRGGEHADQARAGQGGGRLYGRHRSDERQGEVRAQVWQYHVDRRRRVAGHHHEVGCVAGDEARHEAGDALGKGRFREAPVGKAGVVGHVDIARVGTHLGQLGMDGQAAEAGIEHEDGGRAGGHRDRGVYGSGE